MREEYKTLDANVRHESIQALSRTVGHAADPLYVAALAMEDPQLISVTSTGAGISLESANLCRSQPLSPTSMTERLCRSTT